MDPFLVELAQRMDSLHDRGEVERAMDQLEYLYEVLDPEQQEVASRLLAELARRLEQLASGR
jgi:hypothetical protein